MGWREHMEDLASSVWTGRRASPPEIREEIRKAIGVVVSWKAEDCLKGLLDSEVREILKGLSPSENEMGGSDLCPECFSMPGECEKDCGQQDDDATAMMPSTEREMVSVLDEALSAWLEEKARPEDRWSTSTFTEAKVLTKSEGLVVKVGRTSFQITVVKS